MSICLDTWISDTSDPTDLNTKKNICFVPFSHLNHGDLLDHGNSRILTITRITWITLFLFIPCLDQFCLYFPKSSVNGIPRKYKWQKSRTYVRNQTYKRLVWMAALIGYSVAWSVASPKFICLCINFSHYLD